MHNWRATVLVVILAGFLGLLPAACSIDLRTFSGGPGGGGTGGDTAGTSSTTGLCGDGVKNGDETDMDCGNAACGACEDGKICLDVAKQPQDAACKSGHCVDGVCCGDKCSEKCWSCVSANTGKPDGECAPVKPVTDPHNDCMDGGTKKCELTGSCDGAGACAVIGCSFDHGSGHCVNDMCLFDGCSPEYADCNLDPVMDGCEAPLGTVEHCADCTACTVANGTATCEGGQCKVAGCADPFLDCNGDYADGCEADKQTDSMNCGGCGNKCMFENAESKCMAGACAIDSCHAGWGDCDGMLSNGCEYDVSSDVDNCGACGRQCAGDHVASKSCSGGVCNSTCVLGWGNCTKPAAGADDGCESDVSKDKVKCGGCGNDCGQQGGPMDHDFECDGGPSSQKYCGCSNNAGECDSDGAGPAVGACGGMGLCTCNSKACNPGEACAYANQASFCSCKTNAGGAGCVQGETCCQTPGGCFNLATDSANCGACGHSCPVGFVCSLGTCYCDEFGADCDAGGGGTCDLDSGFCLCPMEGGNLCSAGNRCQPGGKCG